MKLLIDTDAFCKLGVAGLLENAVEIFGLRLSECGRLPALPYMLRRGGLRKRYGGSACDALITIAESLPAVDAASPEWLDRLVGIESIDPGEAQLYSVAAEHHLLVLSGDKRALRALKDVAGLAGALSKRVAVLENILLVLCDRGGLEEIRLRVTPLAASDQMVAVCFSAGNADPCECLRSYIGSLTAEVRPLLLWEPHLGNQI